MQLFHWIQFFLPSNTVFQMFLLIKPVKCTCYPILVSYFVPSYLYSRLQVFSSRQFGVQGIYILLEGWSQRIGWIWAGSSGKSPSFYGSAFCSAFSVSLWSVRRDRLGNCIILEILLQSLPERWAIWYNSSGWGEATEWYALYALLGMGRAFSLHSGLHFASVHQNVKQIDAQCASSTSPWATLPWCWGFRLTMLQS